MTRMDGKCDINTYRGRKPTGEFAEVKAYSEAEACALLGWPIGEGKVWRICSPPPEISWDHLDNTVSYSRLDRRAKEGPDD